MKLTAQALYEFDRFRLDPAEQRLLCDGELVPLTPKAFQILCALIQSNGRLLNKDELIKKVWPNSFVEEANLSVDISALRRALGDTPDGQKFIETVPKRGYRFVMPIREIGNGSQSEMGTEESLAAVPTLATPSAPTLPVRPGRVSLSGRWGLPGLRYCLSSFLPRRLFGAPPASTRRTASTQLRRLAVLPLQTQIRTRTTTFFPLADAIIAKLGYVSALTVKPSSAIQKYRDQTIDIPRVAAELNVETLLTGTFVREGDNLRVNLELIDVKSQNILWRDTLNLKYDKLLGVQDTVSQQIIRGLELHLTPSETERMKPDAPVDPRAYEYYLRGVDFYAQADFVLAIKMLEASAVIDPHYALTWAHLGRAYTADASFGFGGRNRYDKAQAAFERAVSLQPAQIEAKIYMANFLTDTGRVEQAVPLIRDALKANPNCRNPLGIGGTHRLWNAARISEEAREHALSIPVKLNTSVNAISISDSTINFEHSEGQQRGLQFLPRVRRVHKTTVKTPRRILIGLSNWSPICYRHRSE
jgi:DNA-binding winged helix-turn-helix (wHTH) protein/TolB-like protein